LVGFVGFLPTLKPLKAIMMLLLANKETLVCGGKLIYEALAKYNRHLSD
jgi:1-deoxy-D-xylulose 5-phosphate reductoisomerase